MVRNFARVWSSRGHEVTVLTTRSDPSSPRFEELEGVAIHRLPVTSAPLFGTLRFISQILAWIRTRKERYDIVCVSMMKYAAAASVLARRGKTLPVVIRTEGGGETGDVAWQASSIGGRWVRKQCERAEAIIAISEPIHQELLDAGYVRERIHRIPNAVPIPDTPWARDRTVEHRRSLGFQEDVPTICYTGRLRPLKGIEDLLQAFSLVEGSLGPCQLLVVGTGPHRARLEEFAASLSIERRVHFSGQVPDVEPYLRASDLYVLPSYVEGMSVSLLEALALGMPATASDIPANRNLVPDSMLSLFPVKAPKALAAGILNLLRPREEEELVVNEVRRFIREEYGIDSVAERYIELFQTLRATRA